MSIVEPHHLSRQIDCHADRVTGYQREVPRGRHHARCDKGAVREDTARNRGRHFVVRKNARRVVADEPVHVLHAIAQAETHTRADLIDRGFHVVGAGRCTQEGMRRMPGTRSGRQRQVAIGEHATITQVIWVERIGHTAADRRTRTIATRTTTIATRAGGHEHAVRTECIHICQREVRLADHQVIDVVQR